MQLSEEKLEAMLKTCVPGGSLCDPQAIADDIREWFSAALRAQADARPVGKVLSEEEMGIGYDRRTGPVVWFGTPKPGLLYTAPPAESAGVLSDEQVLAVAAALESARVFIRNGVALGYIRMPDADCPDPAHGTLPLIERAMSILSRTYAADGEAATQSEAIWKNGYECGLEAGKKAAQQQAEPESVIMRQAQKIGELIADRDSWIEAHARLYRLYHDQSPKAGEEIHVNVEGGDVYTLPLQLSGMDKPRFVVHVPCLPQAEPGADDRVAFDPTIDDLAFIRAWPEIQKAGYSYGWMGIGLAAWRAAQSGQRAGGAEGWQPIETAPKDGRTLLLGYPNSLGKWRTTRGQWMSDDYIVENWEEPDNGDPGWFETSVEADDVPNCWGIEPTHWMPLPAAPTQQQEGE